MAWPISRPKATSWPIGHGAYLGARLLAHEHVGLGIFTTTVALILAADLTVRGPETAYWTR
jgi:hypothetical protein